MAYSESFKQEVILELKKEAKHQRPIAETAKKFGIPVATAYGWIYFNEELLDFMIDHGYKLNRFVFEPHTRNLKKKEEKKKK